uniref:Uncharacterized protein n=1 Tax=Glossina palpalis gambiensis TaxID=67801 RepID=A0A1B0C096_9MUSC
MITAATLGHQYTLGNQYYVNKKSPLLRRHNMMGLFSSFVKKETFDFLHFHNKIEPLFPYVPLNILPKDYS